jgi:hypothetical protein
LFSFVLFLFLLTLSLVFRQTHVAHSGLFQKGQNNSELFHRIKVSLPVVDLKLSADQVFSVVVVLLLCFTFFPLVSPSFSS